MTEQHKSMNDPAAPLENGYIPNDFFNWLDAYCLGMVITQQALRDEYTKMLACPDRNQHNNDFSWVCNECGSVEFNSSVSEADLEWLACSGCGSDEFHKEPKPPLTPTKGVSNGQK